MLIENLAIFLVCIFCVTANVDIETLEIVHVIFRHGEKYPDISHTYPNDPNKHVNFYPFHEGQLNLKGRQTMYDLGHVLRKRYHRFLGNVYSTKEVEAWSSPYVRNLFSLQVVMASLFPPSGSQRWSEDLNWQPTLIHYHQWDDDKIFRVIHNKNFVDLYWKSCQTEPTMMSMVEKYQTWLKYIERYTGTNPNCTRDAFVLYNILNCQEEMNLTLPTWTKQIYPDILKELTVIEFHLEIHTRKLKQMVIGDFLHKILIDTEKRLLGDSKKKFHLYAGHEMNIFHILSELGFLYPHLPDYGACIALEVHKIDDQHLMKVFYKSNKHAPFKLLKNKQGEDRIGLAKFKAIVEDIVSSDFDGNDKNASSNYVIYKYWIIILVLYLLFMQYIVIDLM